LSDVFSVQVPKEEPVAKSRSFAVSGGRAVQLEGVAPLQGKHSLDAPLLPPVVPVAPPAGLAPPVAPIPPVVPVVPAATEAALVVPPAPAAALVPPAPAAALVPPVVPEEEDDEHAVEIAAARQRLLTNENQERVMSETSTKKGLRIAHVEPEPSSHSRTGRELKCR
jgi:hypothetical protein